MTTHPTPFSHLNSKQKLEAGAKPLRFWINSQGEYGHLWDDNTQTVGGSINLQAAATEAGLPWPTEGPVFDRIVERAVRRELHDNLTSPREHVMHRAWTLYQPLCSDLWRVYAGIEYEREVLQPDRLTLEIEYYLTPAEATAMLSKARSIQGHAFPAAEIELMREADDEDPDHNQYCVIFPILGHSVGSLFALQLAWLRDNADLNDRLNSVI